MIRDEHNEIVAFPTVSVGLPVFNGEKTIRQAIESILSQTYTDFELIISDNSSTDLTGQICSEYTKADRRIIYLKQNSNFGASANFKFVLSKARGEYFMWGASDDHWHPLFIEKNISNLEAHPNAISSISNVLLDGEKYTEADSGVFPLTGTEVTKLRTLCRYPGANSRFYSLFRKAAFDKVEIHRNYVAADWSIISELIRKGDMLTIHEYNGFFRSLSGAGSSPKRFFSNRRSLSELFLPYAQFSNDVLARTTDLATIFFLGRLNAKAIFEQLKYFVTRK